MKLKSIEQRAKAWAARRFLGDELNTQVWFNTDLRHDMACAWMLG